MKIQVKSRYKAEITNDVIGRILDALDLPKDYSLVTVTGDGRNIIVETAEKSIFVIVSRESADARNAFLTQYVPTVLYQYINFKTEKRKEIYIYLLDTSDNAKTPFILDTYRVCKTLGIDILNEAELRMQPVTPYSSFKEWKAGKERRKNYNPANDASNAIDDGSEYTVYGKLYGANGKDSVLIACMLSILAKKEGKILNYVQVKEHGTECVSHNDELLLAHYGVFVASGATLILDKKARDKSTCRKQDEFKFNLLGKFGRKKCYMCACDIEANIIASHVHRITDIDHSALSDEEKRRQAVDADNGFWLCANHDKMFEYGIVTFKAADGDLVINEDLKSSQIDYVKNITDVTKVENKHLTNGLKDYLLIHNKRVNLGL